MQLAKSMAWRDGAGCVPAVATERRTHAGRGRAVGAHGELLLWRFPNPPPVDPLTSAVKAIQGLTGERLVAAGVMAAVVDGKGRLLAANRLFQERALRSDQIKSAHFSELVDIGEDDRMRLISEGEAARAAARGARSRRSRRKRRPRALSFCSTSGRQPARRAVVEPAGAARHASDRPRAGGSRRPVPDHERGFSPGRAGSRARSVPVYPGDLVVKEDKAAVADAVRRNARGPAMSGDLAVRLAHQASEPVALTIAGPARARRCRGLAAAQGQ